MRLTIARAQAELVKTQKEATTGQYADLGQALGVKTAQSVSLSSDVLRIDSLLDSNSIVTQRLSGSQSALDKMAESAQKVMSDLIALSGSQDTKSLEDLTVSVAGQLATFTSVVNTSLNGEFLFSGINTDVQPMADYAAPASPAKAAYDNALTTFMAGEPVQVPPLTSVSQFTPDQMSRFITDAVEPLFMGADWNTNWSSATDANITTRISQSEVAETSTNANSEGMRYFAMTAVISKELLGQPLTDDVRAVVSKKAIAFASLAISGIDQQRSALGLSEGRVKMANENLEAQKTIIKTHLGDLNGVDPYEASLRVTNLLDLVEASYTLTARIQQLSLVNFL